ncbi:MAG TPA: hypothetical protein VF156_10530 [Agromyces sp.]
MDMAVQPVISAEQVRIWAGVQGFVSMAALVALALFYALAAPFGGGTSRWSWLGPVNDWLSVIGAAPWIVAMIVFAMRIGAAPWLWVLTAGACVGAAAIAIVTLLMLSGRASLQTQAVVALAATLVAFTWTAVAADRARSTGVIPAWVSFLAIALVVALVVAGVAAGIGALAPAGSAAQTALYVVGGVIGGLAWFGFPVWWLAVASTAV